MLRSCKIYSVLFSKNQRRGRQDTREFGRIVALNGRSFQRTFSTNEAANEVQEIILEDLKGENEGIAVISLNRPSVKNAIGRVFLKQLSQRVADLKNRNDIRTVIIRSLVDGVFCAGADLKERIKMQQEEVGPFVDSLRTTFTNLEKLPMPTIAAIEGSALGGGLELAMACDLRIAAKNALLGLPETKLAIIPGAGGTQRLPRLVGVAKAKELIFTGRLIDGSSALQIGLVNEVTEPGKAFERALEVAREIRSRGPIAIRMAKAAIMEGTELHINTGLLIEKLCYTDVLLSKDRLEGLNAFMEKREPKYTGK